MPIGSIQILLPPCAVSRARVNRSFPNSSTAVVAWTRSARQVRLRLWRLAASQDLQIGLQSAHDAVLRNISRSFDPADFEAKILLLHNADVTYGFDLIYGLPGDSLEGFRASLDFAMSLVPNHLDIFRLSVLPGTRLAETAPALNLEYEACNPYQVIASPTFSRDDIALAARIAHGCDVLYNHGKAVPWFDIIMEALEIPPSEVFERFATWLESHPSEDLTQTQRDFIVALFDESGDSLMGSIAADIISSAVSPSWEKVGILVSIVGVRTVLSYFLRMELKHGVR